MKIELDPEAIKNFNQKAEELLPELKPVPDRRRSSSIPPDLHERASIAEDEIISWSESTADHFGNETGKFFYHQNERIGLIEEGYNKLQQLVAGLLKNKTLRDTVSSRFLTEEIFSWMTAKFKRRNKRSAVSSSHQSM